MSFTPWREAAFLPYPSTSLSLSTSSSRKAKMGLVKDNSEDLSTHDTAFKSDHGIFESRPSLHATASGTSDIKFSEITSMASNNNGSRHSSLNINDADSLDKRFILRAMQKSCSIEFLRKHNLNGTEELILKKRNKASILLAYKDWMAIATDIKINEVVKVKDEREIIRNQNASNLIENKSKSEDSRADKGKDFDKMKSSGRAVDDVSKNVEEDVPQLRRQRLEDTFAVLYNRHCTGPGTNKPRITILLLHEDYPHELPVFGNKRFKFSQSSNGSNFSNISDADSVEVGMRIDSNCSGKQKKKVVRENFNENCGDNGECNKAGHEDDEMKGIDLGNDTAGDHRVICVLGAVRDASDSEIMAAIIGTCVLTATILSCEL